jgi:hypothetical protein
MARGREDETAGEGRRISRKRGWDGREREEKGKEKEKKTMNMPLAGTASYLQIPDADRQVKRAQYCTHMGVRSRVQQAANGWLQPLVTSAAPCRW